MSNPNTSGLPPYQEQRTKKLKSKTILVDKLIPPMNIIKQMKKKEEEDIKKLNKRGKK
jgi:hypothetical protein